jgi:hypothetical protein
LVVDRREDFLDVRDQGRLKTCLSYATSAVHRVNKNIKNHLSPETLHFHATNERWGRGSKIREIQDALLEDGQPEEQHCSEWAVDDIGSWTPPTDVPYYTSTSDQRTPSPKLVKELIRDSELPILGVDVTGDFLDPSDPWIFSAGQPRGKHAVVAAGLARHEGNTAVLIRNSWGEAWACSGYAWLDNSFLERNLKAVLVLGAESS